MNANSVTDKVLNEILDYLQKCDGVEKVVLFGSRARGDYKERSDYDLAIYGNVACSGQIEIRRYCSEIIWTLHKIDLVFVNDKTYPKLKENIEKEGIVLYEQSRK